MKNFFIPLFTLGVLGVLIVGYFIYSSVEKRTLDIPSCAYLLTKDEFINACPKARDFKGLRVHTITVGYGSWYKCSINVTAKGAQGVTIFANVLESELSALQRFKEEGDSKMTQIGNVLGFGELSLLKINFNLPEIVFKRGYTIVDIWRDSPTICSEEELVGLGRLLYDHVTQLVPGRYQEGEYINL